MSENKVVFDVKSQKAFYAPMTEEEIAEAKAFQAKIEAEQNTDTNN